MRMETKLTDEQIDIVRIALAGSPVFLDPSVACYKIGSEIMFGNQNLSDKTTNALVVVSDEQVFYDVVRKDGDIDRHFLILDRNHASGAIVQSKIIKDFEGHHKPQPFHLN